MDLDWRRYRAVVLQSDDWGLCAWAPDDRAHRALSGSPAFRSPAALRYGRSTLESAADVRALAGVLAGVRGADGLPPVLQANTIVANPDPLRLEPPLFGVATLPVIAHPAQPPRWERPGLWEEVRAAESAGLWWAELHGLHHLPAEAWLTALRRGESDARMALEHGSPVCRSVETSSEYDPSEPAPVRAANLAAAVAGFERLFSRRPESFCPPDYRFERSLIGEAARHGIATFQGAAERHGALLTRWRRWFERPRFPRFESDCLISPRRIAFEPSGRDARSGAAAARRRALEAWGRGEPAILSTHRVNYAHLDAGWSDAGRAALAGLLRDLAAEGARFVTDSEVRQLAERGWSVRAGRDRALIRNVAGGHRDVRFSLPRSAREPRFVEPRGAAIGALQSSGGVAEARVGPGEHVVEWESA